MNVFEKIKAIKRPKQLVYKLYNRAQKAVPYSVAKRLSKRNHAGISNEMILETYDGSGQAVHPSVTTFRGKEYFAVSPYPYAREFYENPCLYRKEDAVFSPVESCYPFVRSEKYGYEHFSDPWIGNGGDEIVMIYRRCERKESEKIDQLFLTRSEDGKSWMAPEVLMEAKGDQLISPAISFERKALYCVRMNGKEDTDVVAYPFEDQRVVGEGTVCPVLGLGMDWFVWHIDVHRNLQGELLGCFMLQKKHQAEIISKLGIFVFFDGQWIWQRDVELCEEERAVIKFIYKSTFADDETLFCSACDKKDRWFLFEKKL